MSRGTGSAPDPKVPADSPRLAEARAALGPEVMRLAWHAALPVVITAPLLHLLRINFFLDPPERLPFEAEAELLLSAVFTDVGDGLFEMAHQDRLILLAALEQEYGRTRVHRVAYLLRQFGDETGAWAGRPELERAQQVTALHMLDPAAARSWLTRTQAQLGPDAQGASDARWFIAVQANLPTEPGIDPMPVNRPPIRKPLRDRLFPASKSSAPSRSEHSIRGGSPLFFLSYARADDDGYVKRFYTDLVAEVQRQSGHRGENVGYRDLSSMPAGGLWRDELTEALSRTRTFVALCSPTYYASEYCGKEWSAYRLRLETQRSEQGVYPPTVLPVLWVPGGQIPEVVAEIQYADEELGEVYAREGLHFLLRLTRYRDEYQQVVSRLARRVVAVAEKFSLAAPTESLDLDALPSAFMYNPPSAAAGSRSLPSDRTARTDPSRTMPGGKIASGTKPRTVTVRGGPQHVNFVVMTGSSAEMVHHRRDVKYYGQNPFDWAPYRPQLDQRIAVFAQSVASDRNLTSGLARADEIENLLDQAAEENQLVVLLVDPWATRIEAVRELLSTYDRRNEPTSAVLVPMSASDPETLERYDGLIRDLQQTLSRNLQRGETQLRIEIANPEAFQRELAEALAEAQARVFRSGRVVRRAGGDVVSERPVLGIPERGKFW